MFDASHLTLFYLLAEWAIRLVMIVVIPLRRPPEAARSWLLLVLFLPIPAFILYRLIGRASFPTWRRNRFAKTAPERARIAQTLWDPDIPRSRLSLLAESLGGFPASAGHRIELLTDYERTIQAMVEAIDGAETRVHVLTYIFADDATGQTITNALSRAQLRGVEVRVLFDALGSRPWVEKTKAMLALAGIDARLVLPVRFAALRRARGDLRNHRKLCLIDGRLGFAGSQNIVDRDFKPGVVNDELVARIEGPSIAALDAIFASDWFLETREAIEPLPVIRTEGPAILQAMPSGPDFETPGYERLLVEMVHAAEERITIVSPYLIPDQALLTAIRNAVARRVRVDIVISSVVDQHLVSLAQRSYYDELLASGVRLHLYRDRLLHAKNVLIDEEIGIVGSSNADVRSFVLNAEISVILHGGEAGQHLAAIHDAYIASSDPLKLEDWRARPKRARLAENLARLVSPLL
ncbi:MAG: cardiolipin synthase [Fulvimarina manganoxydans]|uniref:phospholipase D-like domain-containing protein n=1 Tax=Fulvimarina manganoxydans TaxID=937218 RepID=UPI0023568835|nr:phospholipase D-like domain-containing protein [Fulvimarina manganoxydans]MCK5931187.1 cardiolipin synthase [Fulvimarina manganoxydans]